MIDTDFIIQYNKEKHVRRERDLMQGFNHPNIVKLNTTFIHENFIVFDQEFVPNGSLHALIDKYK